MPDLCHKIYGSNSKDFETTVWFSITVHDVLKFRTSSATMKSPVCGLRTILLVVRELWRLLMKIGDILFRWVVSSSEVCKNFSASHFQILLSRRSERAREYGKIRGREIFCTVLIVITVVICVFFFRSAWNWIIAEIWKSLGQVFEENGIFFTRLLECRKRLIMRNYLRLSTRFVFILPIKCCCYRVIAEPFLHNFLLMTEILIRI